MPKFTWSASSLHYETYYCRVTDTSLMYIIPRFVIYYETYLEPWVHSY